MRRTTAALLLTLPLVLTACSGDDAASPEPSPGSVTAPSGPAPSGTAPPTSEPSTTTSVAPPSDGEYAPLLPTDTQLPSGYTTTRADAAELDGFLSVLDGDGATLRVQPPECASTNPFAAADQLALLEGTRDGGAMLVDVAVGARGAGLAAVEQTVADCPTVTVTTVGLDGAESEVQATQEVLPAPPLDADATLAHRRSLPAEESSGAVAEQRLTLAAEVGDTVVLVSGSAADTSTLDTGVLDGLLRATLRNVAEAS